MVHAAVQRLELAETEGGLEVGELEVVTDDRVRVVAAGAADRLCKLIGETPIPASVDGSSVSIVVSIGVASAKAGTQILDELLKRADTALYQAKNNGRNQVVAVSESGDVMSDNKKVANG